MIWTGSILASGYGQMWVPLGWMRSGASDHAMTHRVAWFLAHGPIPLGMHVAHHCDRKRCAALDHLYLATPLDNAADQVARRNGTRAERIAIVLARAS
jgi:hypothetical protein